MVLIRARTAALVACLVAASLVGSQAPATADVEAVEVDLSSFLNNNGITQDPTFAADFDGGGYSYSALALQLGDPVNDFPGIEGGAKVPAGGFEFTWPDRPAGAADNVRALGQVVPVPDAPGATQIGFLGAAVQGSTTGNFVFNYTYVDELGVEQQTSVTRAVGFTDWTRGLLGDVPLEANNTVVTKNLFRSWMAESVPIPTQPHVFLVTAPLNAGMTLKSVKLPISIQIHLFGMAIK